MPNKSISKNCEKRDAFVTKPMPHELVSDFDAAEKLIHDVYTAIYGWLAMAGMYIQAI